MSNTLFQSLYNCGRYPSLTLWAHSDNKLIRS